MSITTVTTPNELGIRVERVFDAPRATASSIAGPYGGTASPHSACPLLSVIRTSVSPFSGTFCATSLERSERPT